MNSRREWSKEEYKNVDLLLSSGPGIEGQTFQEADLVGTCRKKDILQCSNDHTYSL